MFELDNSFLFRHTKYIPYKYRCDGLPIYLKVYFNTFLAYACVWCQLRSKVVLDSLDLDLPVVLSHQIQVLGTKFSSTEKAASALSYHFVLALSILSDAT